MITSSSTLPVNVRVLPPVMFAVPVKSAVKKVPVSFDPEPPFGKKHVSENSCWVPKAMLKVGVTGVTPPLVTVVVPTVLLYVPVVHHCSTLPLWPTMVGEPFCP